MAGFGQWLSNIGTGIFGDSSHAGLLGTGQFKAKTLPIDQSAFQTTAQNAPLKNTFASQLASVQNRGAPVINQIPQTQFRNAQTGLVNQLENQASGVGPSLAQQELQKATDQNIAQSMALAGSQRGQTFGSSLRQIQQNAANAQQQAAGQAANLRLQEQLGAEQALGNVAGQARGQDIGLASDQAGVDLQSRGINDAAMRGLDSNLLDINRLDEGNAQAGQSLGVNQNLGVQGVNQAGMASTAGVTGRIIGGLGTAIAGSGALGSGVQSTVAGGVQNKAFGGVIPGKANVAGDSLLNDKVPAMLSPGEVVVPRSIAQHPAVAAGFIQALKDHAAKANAGQQIAHVFAKRMGR